GSHRRHGRRAHGGVLTVDARYRFPVAQRDRGGGRRDRGDGSECGPERPERREHWAEGIALCPPKAYLPGLVSCENPVMLTSRNTGTSGGSRAGFRKLMSKK